MEEKLNLYPEKFPETVNSEIESIISSDYETVQSEIESIISSDCPSNVNIMTAAQPKETEDELEKEMEEMLKVTKCQKDGCEEMGEWKCNICYNDKARLISYCTKECFDTERKEHNKTHTDRLVPCKDNCSTYNRCDNCKKLITERKTVFKEKMDRILELKEIYYKRKQIGPAEFAEFECGTENCNRFGFAPCRVCPREYSCPIMYCEIRKSIGKTSVTEKPSCKKDCKEKNCKDCQMIASQRRKNGELRHFRYRRVQAEWLKLHPEDDR